MIDYTADQVYTFISRFTPIYEHGKVTNPIPDGVKITVFCEGREESGFVENITHDEMGIEKLIAKSWILQSELDDLLSALPTASNNEFKLTKAT